MEDGKSIIEKNSYPTCVRQIKGSCLRHCCSFSILTKLQTAFLEADKKDKQISTAHEIKRNFN